MAIAQSDNVQSTLGFTGKGVNVAVYEDGPDVTTNLSITAQFLASPATSSTPATPTGSSRTSKPNKPHGHAPDCNLFSANSTDLDALRWAAQTSGCTVISQSFHRDAEHGDSGLSSDDIYKDWLALHWPYPTIVQAAGNGDADASRHRSSSTTRATTASTVGNHDDTAGAMSGDSVFRNPTSTHGDRELPEIAANGTGVRPSG